MQIIEFLSAVYFCFFRALLITEGPISGPNGFEQNRYRLPKGFGRGPDANYLFFFRALLFLIRAPPNYQGAGVRTEGLRTKPISAPKGFGRGPDANYLFVSGPFFSSFGPLLITKGSASEPKGLVQNRHQPLRD